MSHAWGVDPGLIYEALEDPAAFGHVAQATALATSARSSLLLAIAPGEHVTQSYSSALEPRFIERYAEFAAYDPWTHAFLKRGRRNGANSSEELLSEAELRGSLFYNDFLRPEGIRTRHLAAAVYQQAGHRYSISVQRDEGEPAFGAVELHILDDVGRHLARVLRLRGRIEGLEGDTRLTRGALDRLSSPVLVLSGDGAASYVNAAAERMLQQGVLLTTRDGRVQPVSGDRGARFQETVRAIADGICHGAQITLGDPDAGAPTPFSLAPLPASAWRTQVLVVAPGQKSLDRRAGEQALISYGLTKSEAEVAVRLAEGSNVEALAAARGVSPLTIRSQLKRVHEKLGVNRQAELVTAVIRVATRLLHEPD